MGNLFTPWRLAYLRGEHGGSDCIFCAALAGADDEASLIVHRGEHVFVMLNRYPYSNGHLMVSPNVHVGELAATTAAARSELLELASRAEQALAVLYRPHGFNLGMNLGRCAGAGVVGHLHLHVVPRWDGDTNFMSVVNDVRIVPEPLLDSWRKLRGVLAGSSAGSAHHGASAAAGSRADENRGLD